MGKCSKWLWGLIPLALLLWAAMMFRGPAITADVTARAAAQLKTEGYDWASIAVTGRDATLSGLAPNADSRTLAANAADRVAGVRLVNNTADLAKVLKPYAFNAEKVGPALTLSGGVPAAALKGALADTLKKAVPTLALTDKTEIAAGAPQGFGDVAGFGLGQLSRLTNGKLSITDKALSIEGQAPTMDAYSAVTKALQTLPAGATLARAAILPPGVSPYTLGATLDGPLLTLTGYVPSEGERDMVLKAAQAAAPKAKIVDQLQLGSGAPNGFSPLAAYGLSQLGALGNGKMSLVDTALSLEGNAPNLPTYGAVTQALRALPPGATLANAAIMPPRVSPYTLGAALDGQSLTLTGFVPNEGERDMVLKAAQAAAPKAKIVDQLQIGSGAPNGFGPLAAYGLGQLGTLGNGKMSLVDTTLSLEGNAPNAQAHAAVTQALRSLPMGAQAGKIAVSLPVAKPYRFEAVNDGAITRLAGNVPSEAAGASIVKAVKGPNAFNFSFAGGDPSGWTNAATHGLVQLGQLRNGKLTIVDHAVSLEGLAPDMATHDGVLAALKQLPSGYTLANAAIAVARQPVKPYLMSYDRTANGLIVKGLVPNEDAHKGVINAAREVFPGVNITDQVTLAEGVPAGMDWLAANRFAVQQLARLKSGTAAYRDDTLAISGEAADQGVKAAVENTLRGALPAAVKLGAVAIKAPEGAAAPAQPSPIPPPPLGQMPPAVAPAAPAVERPTAITPDMTRAQVKQVCQAWVNDAIEDEQINFETGSDRIKGESAMLRRVADMLKRCVDMRVTVEGHTDNVGNPESNVKLSEARAHAVVRALTALGVTVERLDARGYGDSKPVAGNDTAEGRAKNRRIEFVVNE